MKRRNFLVKSIVSVTSAAVYSATGWLMGTRTLTMPGNGQWGSWFYEEDCSFYGTSCGCYSDIVRFCDYWSGCPETQHCYEWDIEHVYCCMDPYTTPECKFRMRSYACGSCVGVGVGGPWDPDSTCT
jgi:hypothetical protein